MRFSLSHAISPLFLLEKRWLLSLMIIFSANNYGILLKIIAVFWNWIQISLGLYSLKFFDVFIKSGHFCVLFSWIQSWLCPWLLCLVFLTSLKWISFEARRLLQNNPIFIGLIMNALLILLHIIGKLQFLNWAMCIAVKNIALYSTKYKVFSTLPKSSSDSVKEISVRVLLV